MTDTPYEEPHHTEKLAHALEERVKELHCLYEVSAILADERRSVDEKLQSLVESLPAGMQFPSIAAARLRLDNRTFESSPTPKVVHQQSSDIRVFDEVVGQVEVVYKKTIPDGSTPAFLREEALLIHEVARRLADFLTSEWRRERAHHLEQRRHSQASGAAKPAKSDGPQGLVGQSTSMRAVYRAIEKATTTSATVLIHGESGTGKELVARAIHYGSKRSGAPFVPVNCAAIPESLVESELFGYVKGAFTGADTTRAGFFQTAEGGTIFLDEVSEMNTAVQAKLLRVLQNQEVRMVGSDHTRATDVRILAATNQNLADLVEAGRFRADLFFRLHVLTIDLPPLRERRGDVKLLISHFVDRWARQTHGERLAFSDRALSALESYDWPGNVRELDNLIQRLSVMSDDRYVDINDLPGPMHFEPNHTPNTSLRTLHEVELDHVQRVLDAVDGNRSRAADILGIDRKTLRKKLDAIERPGDVSRSAKPQ